MVLDWAIGNDTCEVALNKGNYICGANSNCSNRTNGPGYRCKCKEGYEGNHSSKRVAKTLTNVFLKTSMTAKAIKIVLMNPDVIIARASGDIYHADGEACVADQPAPKSSLAINLSIE
uniref:EGF-like domain-containing protein n=1 Tax=Quercus lobata TaxID=97700 RepID=A0A7N2LFS4_QUELO